MKTFRAHTSFITESVIMGASRLTAPIVIIPKTDYKIVDVNKTAGIYIEVSAPTVVDSTKFVTQQIYISPEEIVKYGEIQQKITLPELRKILDKITFVKSCIDFSWGWEITEVEGQSWTEDIERNKSDNTTGWTTNYDNIKGFLINTTFKRPDINTGVMGIGRGRRMWIEETASEASVVMTAWVCVELIVKHETMESFLYSGAKILNPHKTLEELAYPQSIVNNIVEKV